MRKGNNYFFAAVIISILSAVIFFFVIYNFPLQLYPDNKTFFDFDVVSNIANERGFSEMGVDSSSGHLHFRYNYEKGNDDPFAILIFHAHELARHLNLGDYKYIDLDIDPKLTQDFTVSMYVYIPETDFSNIALAETHRPYSMKIRIEENKSHYHYKIADFATPAWWFAHYQVDDYSLPKTNWNNFTHMTITNYEQNDTTLQVVMKGLRFTDSIKEKIIYSIIFCLFVFIISLIFYSTITKKMQSVADTKHHDKYTDETAQNLLEYIEKNISNPLLSLDLINKEVGINSFVVNEILKDQKDVQYKKYIDTLRIEKAKRMLTESEHQISVIAEQVGYCYSNSFSRIFGKYCGMTPNEYRNKFGTKN
ncbi:MAG: AraC family transcriptional regulator [Chitinivibrionia bacterium]|nr:AraC family transcriptional regulator [Chitinivibrionia bacterium]